jgi:hypothetical protein
MANYHTKTLSDMNAIVVFHRAAAAYRARTVRMKDAATCHGALEIQDWKPGVHCKGAISKKNLNDAAVERQSGNSGGRTRTYNGILFINVLKVFGVSANRVKFILPCRTMRT